VSLKCPNRKTRGVPDEDLEPRPETVALLRVSGNPINGSVKPRHAGLRPFSGIRRISIHGVRCNRWRARIPESPGSQRRFRQPIRFRNSTRSPYAQGSPARDLTKRDRFRAVHEATISDYVDDPCSLRGHRSRSRCCPALAHNYERLREFHGESNAGVAM